MAGTAGAGDTVRGMTAPAAHALVLDFVLTVRHDGRGGVADDLADTEGLAAWIREHADALGEDARGAPADEGTLAAVRGLRAAVRSLFARAVLPGPPSRADADRLPPAALAAARLNAAAAAVPVVPALHWPDGAEPASALVPAPGFAAARSARAASGDPGAVPGGPGAGGGAFPVPAGRSPRGGAAAGGASEAGGPAAGSAAHPVAAPAQDGPPGAGHALGAVLARAAIAFLASPDRARLRACHAPRCVRYFLKDHPRQEWCKPACGNRARVARHHERRRACG